MNETAIILGLIMIWLMELAWLIPNVVVVLMNQYKCANLYLKKISPSSEKALNKCGDETRSLRDACERIIKYYKIARTCCIELPIIWLLIDLPCIFKLETRLVIALLLLPIMICIMALLIYVATTSVMIF